ncbi:hypothetical protein [Amycolatopsis sp. BJA-103]|uniref:hypothetical protein n=1 Tax=Amycolatopsis sp. BJA-103 TaxID=1911175 RepID=UPI001E5151B5|nr:hypothetical protein [Amycolatopsis sp. BJA-103]
MAARGDPLPGSARLELADDVLLLRPEDAVLTAMLAGWEKQQRSGRRLQQDTVDSRRSVIRRFTAYTNEYPWHWTAVHMNEWTAELVMKQELAESTLRNYQGAIRMFCDYITSPHYGWVSECEARFGTHPVQIVHEWNSAAHLVDYEGGPGRRPLTREECQALFDYADDQVERAVQLGRKGALSAYRDATVLKVNMDGDYASRRPASWTVLTGTAIRRLRSLVSSACSTCAGAKRSRGSPPKRRMVASTMPWAVEAVEDYLINV